VKAPKYGIFSSKVPLPNGKGGRQEMLPSRHALAELTHGNPMQRSMGNYAKLTPSGAGAISTYDGIMAMANRGASAKPK